MPNIAKYDVKREYASWMATPSRLKTSLKLPSTKKDFADMKGVSVRTLNRWEQEESFQTLVQQRRMELANATPNSTVSAVGPPRPAMHGTATKKYEAPRAAELADDPAYDPTLTPDEQKYQQVKDTLVGLAMNGNQGAIDLYMKHYGKPFIESEQKFGKMFPSMNDEELEAEIINLIGAERISFVLSRAVADA